MPQHRQRTVDLTDTSPRSSHDLASRQGTGPSVDAPHDQRPPIAGTSHHPGRLLSQNDSVLTIVPPRSSVLRESISCAAQHNTASRGSLLNRQSSSRSNRHSLRRSRCRSPQIAKFPFHVLCNGFNIEVVTHKQEVLEVVVLKSKSC